MATLVSGFSSVAFALRASQAAYKGRMKRVLPVVLVLAWLNACTSFYTGIVSLTKVVDDAAHDYARLYLKGLVPAEVATKASRAYADWQTAVGLLADALEAVKAGKQGDANVAFAAARTAANNFVDTIFGVIGKQRTTEVRALIAKANGL